VDVIGFASDDALEGEEVKVVVGGKINGFEDLQAGIRYYLSTNGSITPTPTVLDSQIPVGIAFSEEELLVQLGN
jgi:hypothetical protein